jgi:hypothetical protein
MKNVSTFGISALLLSAGLCCGNATTSFAGVTYAYASQVVSGGSGTYTSGWNGQLNSNAGYGSYTTQPTPYYHLTPFEPAFVTPSTASYVSTKYSINPGPVSLAQINPGSALVLQLANGFAAATSTSVNNGFTLGIHAGVGLYDQTANSNNDYSGTGVETTPATIETNTRASYLAVGDGTNWAWFAGETLNAAGTAVLSSQWTPLSSTAPTASSVPSGAVEMTFNDPSAYYASTAVAPDGGNNTVTPSADTPLADPSIDFTGTPAAFNGEDYSQVMSTLNGSAGGTWFDLANSGLAKVTEVAFVVPTSQTSDMYVQAVVGDTTPEPASLSLLAVSATTLLLVRRGKNRLA